MSSGSSRKFKFSDIVRKLNETSGAIDRTAPVSPKPMSPEASKSADVSSSPRQLPPQPTYGNAGPSTSLGKTSRGAAPGEDSRDPNVRADAPPSFSAPEASFQTPPPPADDLPPPITPAGPAAPSGRGGESDEEEETFDIYRYLGVVVRRKFIIFVATVVATLFSLQNYLTSEKQYHAHARLLFSPGRQDIVPDDYSSWAMLNDREEKLNTHIELLRSDLEVLQRVAQAVDNRVSASEIAGGLSVVRGESEGKENDIIEIYYRHPEAEVAREVANQLCIQYLEYIREVQAQDMTRVIAKFEEQIRKVEKDLKEKEDNLRLFKEKNRFVELSSQASALVAKTAELEASLQKTQLDLQDNRERIVSMQNQISKQEIEIINSVTYQDLYRNRLNELQFELNTLLAEYSSNHYKVKMVEKEIERLKEAIRSQATTKTVQSETFVKNPLRESLVQSLVTLTIDKASLEAKRTALEQLIIRHRDEMMKLPLIEQKYAMLQRESESLLQTLQMLKLQYEKVKIKRDSQETDLKILQLARLPTRGVRSVKVSQIYMGIIIGLIIGIGLAFLFEHLDQTIKDPSVLERGMDLPLLGIVPLIEGDKPIIDISSGQEGRGHLEPFRVLRTNLKHIASVHNLKTIIICSAVKGEGKTTLAVNLAISFAMDGKKVILVDGDLRRPQIHSILNIPRQVGLSDYLTGVVAEGRHLIKKTRHDNLSVITAGERPHHPAELLGTIRFQRLVDELKQMADVIIFDSPALLPVSDGMTMAPQMDGCVLVARTLWTPMKALRQGKMQLERIGTKLVGSVVNGISHSRGYYPYYYGYYRYYAYKYTYEYDEEPRREKAVRVFGLKVEAWLRDTLLELRHAVPRLAAETVKEMKGIAFRKTFWLLLTLFILSSVLVPWIRQRRGAFLPPKVQYLGEADNEAHGGKHLRRGNTFFSAAKAPQSVAQTSYDDVALNNDSLSASGDLRSCLEAWRYAFRRNDWHICRRYYDSAAFRFQGGGFEQYEKIVSIDQLPPRIDTALVGPIETVRMNDSLWNASMEIAPAAGGEAPRRRIVQIWRRSGDRWLIVAEKREQLQ